MEITLQNVFYFTASVVFIVILITCIWLMQLLSTISRFIKNVNDEAHKLNTVVNDIKYFSNRIKSKTLKLISKTLNK